MSRPLETRCWKQSVGFAAWSLGLAAYAAGAQPVSPRRRTLSTLPLTNAVVRRHNAMHSPNNRPLIFRRHVIG